MGVYLSKVFESCFLKKDDNLIKGKLQVIKMGNISKEVTSPLQLIDLYERANYWYHCSKYSNDLLERLNYEHIEMRNLFNSLVGLTEIKNKFIEWGHVIKSITNKETEDVDKISSINAELSHDSMFKFLTTNDELKNEYNIRMNTSHQGKKFYKLYKKKAMNCFRKDKTNFCITLAKYYDIIHMISFNQRNSTIYRTAAARQRVSTSFIDHMNLPDLFLSNSVNDIGIYSTWQSNNISILERMIGYIKIIKKEYMRLCFKYSISNVLYSKYNYEYYEKFTDYLNVCSDNIYKRLPIDLQVCVVEYLVDPNLKCPNIRYISNVFWSDKRYILRYQKKREYFRYSEDKLEDCNYMVGDNVVNITSGYSWGKIVSINYKNKCVELSNYRIAKFNTCAQKWIPKRHYTLFYVLRPLAGIYRDHNIFKNSKFHKEERRCFKKYIIQKKYKKKVICPRMIEKDGCETTR